MSHPAFEGYFKLAQARYYDGVLSSSTPDGMFYSHPSTDPAPIYEPPPLRFPRSERELDAIMMRRVNARLELQQAKMHRRQKHLTIGVVAVIFAPLVIAAISKLWEYSLMWLAA